ncbi:MAG: methyltransferase domain-containing protein [Thermodesulfobacteriota bacterium]
MAELVPAAGEPSAGQRVVPCAACGGTQVRVLLTPDAIRGEQRWLERFHAARVDGSPKAAKDRASFTQAEPTNVVACVACGTLLRDPQPTCELLGEIYAADQYGRATLEALARNQDRFFAAKLEQLAASLRELGAGARVLEVGSFVGGFLRAAARRGWRATGVDVGEETTGFMRADGLDVRSGDLLELELERDAFDAVFVWNTFDQLCNPGDVLRRVHALLGPRGLVVLRVPNGRFEAACLELRAGWRGTAREQRILAAQAYENFVTFPYLAGYTPESLCALLAAHGFACACVHGDTILDLADERTKPFAVAEEARYKRAVMRACRAAERATGLLFHPWIDVVARKGRAA